MKFEKTTCHLFLQLLLKINSAKKAHRYLKFKTTFYCTNVRLVKPTFCDQLKIDDLPMLASENILKLDNMTKN